MTWLDNSSFIGFLWHNLILNDKSSMRETFCLDMRF